MSFAFLPFYTGDYFRDTRGLSMAGHGCYFLLLTYCWDVQGPLPLDEERIAGICEATNQEERGTMQRILRTYFTQMADGWYNNRMQREIDRANVLSDKRRSSGREGANARMRLFRERNLASAKQVPSKSQASAKQVTLHSQPQPQPQAEPSHSSGSAFRPGVSETSFPQPLLGETPNDTHLEEKKPTGKALRDAAKRVIDRLNKLAGRRYDYVDPNMKPILARFAEGYTERELCAIAAVKAREWKADEAMEKFIRPKTLFNATNAAQYRAELPANKLKPEESS